MDSHAVPAEAEMSTSWREGILQLQFPYQLTPSRADGTGSNFNSGELKNEGRGSLHREGW